MKKWIVAFVLCLIGRWIFDTLDSENLKYFIAYATGVTVAYMVIKEAFFLNGPRRINVMIVEREEDTNKRP